jgi:hypothetical protein
MKKHLSPKSPLLNFLPPLAIIWMLSGTVVHAQSVELFAVSDLSRVFEDGYNLPLMHDTLKLFGIRGEIVSGQFALTAKKDLKDVTVEVGELKDRDGGAALSTGAVGWNFVGSIPLSANAPNQPGHVTVRSAPARFPDYIMPDKQINLDKGMFRSVWLTISIPYNAVAGGYSGNVTVKSSKGEASLPVYLRVYPLSLPEARHLKVTEWYNTRNFEKLHGVEGTYSEDWFNMLRTYAENMAAHRQNVFQVSMNSIEISLSSAGELAFDFTRFDQIAQVFWDTEQMDYLETGFLAKFGEGAWFSTEIVLKDFRVKSEATGEEITVPGKDIVPVLLPAFERHLRRKGWLDKTLFHIHDEPTLRNVMAWRELSAYLHRYAPELTRIDAIETTNLFDDIEIAVPKLDYLGAWYDIYNKAAREGTEIWFYTVGIYQANSYPNKTIDMPVMDNRILHWLNYKYDLSGFLHWGWNQWTENPYADVGMHIGDGWHVYPVKEGVLNSLRWEQMRNGLQDYEYFWMLENRIAALKDSLGLSFKWIDPKQRPKEIAGQVVMDLLNHTHDPEVLYQAKKEVIEELLVFNTSPMIYVQTNPAVNSTVVKGQSYLVELLGWTEPGTKIVANDEEIPVDEQGLFLWNFSLSEDNNSIIIKASNEHGSKELLREFVVEY